jgi:hypothetical protein
MTDQTTATGTPAGIRAKFDALIAEIEAIPGEITEELSIAKTRLSQATTYLLAHFCKVEAAAVLDAKNDTAAIETDAAKVETEAEKVEGDVKTEADSVVVPLAKVAISETQSLLINSDGKNAVVETAAPALAASTETAAPASTDAPAAAPVAAATAADPAPAATTVPPAVDWNAGTPAPAAAPTATTASTGA